MCQEQNEQLPMLPSSGMLRTLIFDPILNSWLFLLSLLVIVKCKDVTSIQKNKLALSDQTWALMLIKTPSVRTVFTTEPPSINNHWIYTSHFWGGV